MKRPLNTEYAEFYGTYVSLVPETDVLSALESQMDEVVGLLDGINEEKSLFRYAAGKWSIREVVGHLIDGERVFAYRAFRIGRGDATPLESFDENFYVANSRFDEIPLSLLVREFVACRAANLFALRSFDDGAWDSVGTASGHPVTARAVAFIMVGHVRHHLGIVRERYLRQ